jgi:hypothetical protein
MPSIPPHCGCPCTADLQCRLPPGL